MKKHLWFPFNCGSSAAGWIEGLPSKQLIIISFGIPQPKGQIGAKDKYLSKERENEKNCHSPTTTLNFKEIYQFQRFLWNWENILFTWSQFADLEAGSSQNCLTSHKLRISEKDKPMGNNIAKIQEASLGRIFKFLLHVDKTGESMFSWRSHELVYLQCMSW